VTKSEADVYYVDHCDRDELRIKYKHDNNVPIDRIPEIDFVVRDGKFVNVVRDKGPYQTVIASHVIEHVPDIIGWLSDVWTILETGGKLCLAVPDKRFTFDCMRRSSTIKDAKEAFAARRWRPSLDSVCDSYRNVVGVTAEEIWTGRFSRDNAEPGWPDSVVQAKIDDYLKGEYVDVHCWVFSPWEFIRLIGNICDTCGIHFRMVHFLNTKLGDEEFHVQLQKSTPDSLQPPTAWAEAAHAARLHAAWPKVSSNSGA
jgi:hypothetical protein